MFALQSTNELGRLVKKTRKASGMTQVEAAGACGVGVRFLSELENGKPAVQLDSVLAVLSGLGLQLHATAAPEDAVWLPRDVTAQLAELHDQLAEAGHQSLAVRLQQPEITNALQLYRQAIQLAKPVERLLSQTDPANTPPQTAPARRSLIGL